MAQVLKIESLQSEKSGSVSFGLASPSPSPSPSSSVSLPPTPEPTPQPISEQDPLPEKTTTTTTTTTLSTPHLSTTTSIAIIGGGIIGLITALGLIHRGLHVTVYERASKLTETSAGFSFNAVAREAMEFISPKVREALRSVAAPNEYPFIRYFDGYTPDDEGKASEPLWQIPADRPDYHGCLRAAFLEALGREIPEGVLRFGMGLEGYEEVDTAEGEKVRLQFAGGEVIDVDAVIGCDGIKSRTRQIMIGEDDPAALPGFTHMVAYRAVIPLGAVVAAMGEDKGYSHCLHVGPGAYTVTYPIANNTLSNIILFCKTSTPWLDTNRLLATCHRSTAQAAVSAWKPDVRGVVDLLPETPTKWAIFDMSAHPAKTYTKGRVCIAGDAAHASTPFLASGAAMGVEDAAVLAATLETALGRPSTGTAGEKTAAITAAFRTFSALRLERSQMVVRYSREVGEMCMWQDEEVGRDPKRCFEEIWRRYCDVWEFDVQDMVNGARKECRRLLEGDGRAKTLGIV